MKTINVACKAVLLAMVAGSAAAASETGAAATGLEQTVFSAVKNKLTGLFWGLGQKQQPEGPGFYEEAPAEDDDDAKERYIPDWSQYEDETVLRFNWTTARERKAFVDATKTLVLDVWRVGKHSGDVRLHQTRVPNLLRLLPKSLRRPESRQVMIADLEHAVHSTHPEPREVVDFSTKSSMDIQSVSELFFSDFRSLESIYQWLDILEETFPEHVRTEVIGKTHEGRDIRVYHLYSSQREVVGQKKTIVITGGIHAREWISVSTVLYSLYTLLVNHGARGGNGAGSDDAILHKLDFLIVPVLNPDGYVYTWEHDRLWRKNRQDTGVPLCRGIDIDSSFPYHWKPSMGTPCSEGYAGQEALEAREAKAFTEYINATEGRHRYFGFMDWHSYSQTILHPYGYSCKETPRDEENLLELAYGMARAIRWSSGKMYSVMPSCEDREYDPDDSEGGCALDYMYKIHAIWAFQIKLRDTGNHGFLLPKKFIVPVGEEIFSALKYFCDFILNPEDDMAYHG